MNYKDFMNTIKKEKIAPAYLFQGVETYIGQLLIENILEKIVAPGFEVFNYSLFKDKETTVSDIVQSCNTLPLGSQWRVVVAREETGIFERNSERDIEDLSAYLKDPSPSTVLIFTLVKGDKRKKIYQSLASNSVLVELDKLNEKDLTNWIAARIKEENKTIQRVALKKLIHHLKYLENKEMTITHVDNEVQRLVNYLGEEAEIRINHVQAVIPLGIEENIFKMLDFSLQGRVAEAIAISGELISKGESPFAILGLIIRQMRLLLMTKLLLEEGADVGAIAKATGLPRYVAEKNCRLCRDRPQELFFKNFVFIQDLDVKMKTGGIEAEKGIEWALLNMKRD